MSKAKRPEPQPWLKYIVLPLLLILFGLLVSTLVLPKPVIAPSDGILTPTPSKSLNELNLELDSTIDDGGASDLDQLQKDAAGL